MHNVNGSTDKLNLELFYYCHFSKWENQKEVQIISFEFLMNTEQTGFHKATPSSIFLPQKISFVPLLPTSFLFSGISFRPDLSGSQCDAPSDTSYSSWKSTISSTSFSRSTSLFFFRWELIETSQSNWYLRNPLKMSISKNTRSHTLMTKKRFSEMLIRKVEGWRGRGELMVLNDYLC